MLSSCEKKEKIPQIDLLTHNIMLDSLQQDYNDKLADLENILNDLLAAHDSGVATWKILFDKLGDYFDKEFGPEWKEKNKDFWSEFSRTYHVSEGIKSRLLHDEKVRSKF